MVGNPVCLRKRQKVLLTAAHQKFELPKNFEASKWSLLNIDFASMNSKLGRFANVLVFPYDLCSPHFSALKRKYYQVSLCKEYPKSLRAWFQKL